MPGGEWSGGFLAFHWDNPPNISIFYVFPQEPFTIPKERSYSLLTGEIGVAEDVQTAGWKGGKGKVILLQASPCLEALWFSFSKE